MRSLTDAHMSSIIKALRGGLCTIKVLDLEQNNFTSVGISVLCDFLLHNQSIREINAANNKINITGAEKVLDMLQENNTITSFHLDGNEIPDPVLQQINYATFINNQPVVIKRRLSKRASKAAFETAKMPTTENEALIAAAKIADESVESVLDLSNNNGKISLQLLKDVVSDAENVESLSLANCGLSDPGFEMLAPVIAKMPHLHYLNLTSNSISSHSFRPFCELLKKNKSITTIVLAFNKINDDAARGLIEALQYNDTIVDIDVHGNAITEIVQATLKRAIDVNRQPTNLKKAMQAMQHDDPRVVTVELQWYKNMQQAGYFFGPVLKNSTHITILNLSNAGLQCQGAKDLAAGVKFNKALKRIELANNYIKDEGGLVIVQAISYHPTLKEINLANNFLGNLTARAIIDMLAFNDVLIACNVELNKIDDTLLTEIEGLVIINQQPIGVKRILPLIETNDPGLTTIDFSENDGQRYQTTDSVRVLCISLIANNVVKYLDLSNNAIGDIGANYLAEYLLRTNSLETVKLNNISLTDVGAEAIINNLRANDVTRIVEMKGNPLTDITGNLFLSLLLTNTSIVEVHLEKTRVSSEIQEDIRVNAQINAEPFCLKKALLAMRSGLPDVARALDLSSSAENTRKVTDETVRILCLDLLNNCDVQSLDLTNASIGLPSAKRISELLANPQNNLHSIILASIPIDDTCVGEIAKGIAVNRTLRELDLRATNVTSDGIMHIVEALKSNNTVVAVLVNRNKLSSHSVGALSRELALNTQVTSLKDLLPHIYDNDPSITALTLHGTDEIPFSDISCQLLCLGLQKNHVVTTLDLSCNNISSVGIEYLVDMLQDNKTLQYIDLHSNRIDDEGGRMLVKCLETNDSIINLNLDENHISEEVMTELLYMLGINNGPTSLKNAMVAISTNDPSVVEVDFNGLHKGVRLFDDEAIHTLCSLLVSNTLVKAIDLANNEITDAGAVLLADALRINTSLEALYLENNKITREGALALYQTLKSNHVLHTLNLDDNNIPPHIIEDIHSVLAVNATPLRIPRLMKNRPINTINDHIMFRDHDYLHEKNIDILEDALVHCPRGQLPKTMRLKQFQN